MNTINNKTIFLRLAILAFLAFGVTMPAYALTDYDIWARGGTGALGGYTTTSGNSYPNGNPPIYYPPQPVYVPAPTPVYVNPAPTPVVYSSSTNPNPTTTKKVAVATAKKTTPAKPAETNSDLTASAIFGSDSFMPSGLVQWILFAILVLLIVILVRRIYGGREKYHAIPIKHK